MEIHIQLVFFNKFDTIVETVNGLLKKGFIFILILEIVLFIHKSKIYFSWVGIELINRLVLRKHIILLVILQNHIEFVFLISTDLYQFFLKHMIIRHSQSIPVHIAVLKVVLNCHQYLNDFEILFIHVVKSSYIHMDWINEHLIVCIVQTLEMILTLFLEGLLIF